MYIIAIRKHRTLKVSRVLGSFSIFVLFRFNEIQNITVLYSTKLMEIVIIYYNFTIVLM